MGRERERVRERGASDLFDGYGPAAPDAVRPVLQALLVLVRVAGLAGLWRTNMAVILRLYVFCQCVCVCVTCKCVCVCAFAPACVKVC